MIKTKSIHDYENIIKDLDLNINNLGSVMLPVNAVDLFEGSNGNFLNSMDLYKSSTPLKFWINGDVTNRAHATLLYGLLTPAYKQQENIDELLASWERPKFLTVDDISVFPSTDPQEPYGCVVAHVSDDSLYEAHKRLSYLPHVNTFPDYRPHVALAYVKEEVAEHWAEVLSWSIVRLEVLGEDLDYGSNKN